MKIIAESASNHNGNIDYLKKLAKASKTAGADYFTFQVFDPESFCVSDYERFDIVKEIAFSLDQWSELINYCIEIELEIIPCALDIKSFHFCLEKGLSFFKIHATDIINVPFLREIKKADKIKVLLETQCATYQDIKLALEYVKGQLEGIIHGFSNYPTEVEDLNLNALDYISEEFGCNTGLADHSLDTTEIPLMVLAKGAKYLEKHITLSRNDRQYDWQVSLYPHEFATMAHKINHYQTALGKKVKHPTQQESSFRGVLYKKVLDNDLEKELKRANYGNDYLTEVFSSFDRQRVGIGIIARLKSQRLEKKVLRPFLNNTIIEDLYHRIKQTKGVAKTAIITSFVEEDSQLASYCEKAGIDCFRGHPISVIDRMLSFALKEKLGVLCRVTGDNPFSDPTILESMIDLMQENNLDYVKVNNVPTGVGVELYSTSYLWNLYLTMDNPHNSEYLAWIALNDETSAKGCIEVVHENKNLSYYNVSIDYMGDYDRCKKVLQTIGKKQFENISLEEILGAMDAIEPADKNMAIKLPGGVTCTFEEFNLLINNANYRVRKKMSISK